jgi:DNA-binding NarL/FixJ family response regulator
MNAPHRVFLVDDHPFVRLGLRTALERESDFVVIGEAATFAEALARIPELRPDLLVLDLNLVDGNGWTLIERLREAAALPPTLVLSVCDEVLYAERLLRAGARGYLMKQEPAERIVAALREIHAGNLVASPAVTSRLLREGLGQDPAAEPATPGQPLGDQELRIFDLLAEGRRNCEIAEHLRLSEKTVSTVKTRIMKKLGATSTAQLLLLAQKRQQS